MATTTQTSQNTKKEIFGVDIATWSYLAIGLVGAVYILPKLITTLKTAGDAASAVADEEFKSEQSAECAAQARQYARDQRESQGWLSRWLTFNHKVRARNYNKAYDKCMDS
jgi:hypothetical protein